MHPPMIKYPRTHHLVGSRLQHGDHDLAAVPFAAVRGRHVVAEEKMDGANAGISFTPEGALLLQSRGHYLEGGPRERHFDLFKQWANTHVEALYCALGERYVMYGEWLYAKHTCFYDALPHYFMEFDVFDRVTGDFLSTARRGACASSPISSARRSSRPRPGASAWSRPRPRPGSAASRRCARPTARTRWRAST